MPDNLPGRSRDEGAGRALTRVEFEQRERARKALELWKGGSTYTQIKNALRLRNVDEARRQVSKGEEVWESEERGAIARYQSLMRDDMMELRVLLMEAAREGNLGAVDRVEKVWSRMARLMGLDAEKDIGGGGGDTIILAGGDVNLVPRGAGTVIDVRAPWDRPELQETIEGEVVPENEEGTP